MILADYHVHTDFCDGKNSPEEMVLAAIKRGMRAIGFSGHSYTHFDDSWCMSEEGTCNYLSTINELKKKYASEIQIYCGIEADYHASINKAEFDYAIGSVHYLLIDGEYIPVDESAEILQQAAEKHCEGDIYRIAEIYYDTLASVVDKTNCDIIGHFDLISKFNENSVLFDEAHPRYISAYQSAADRLLTSGKYFEINTGAIARGYKTKPYPAPAVHNYLRQHGARFLLSGDAHDINSLCFEFDRWEFMLHS